MERIIKRINTKNLNKKDCYICNRYGYIAELHHLITISDINKMLYMIEQYSDLDIKDYFEELNSIIEGIWLCPNHHLIYHKLLSKQSVQIALMISENEKEKYNKLFEHVKYLYEKLIQNMKDKSVDRRIIVQLIRKKIRIEEVIVILQEMLKN